jgi:hypothetical protein
MTQAVTPLCRTDHPRSATKAHWLHVECQARAFHRFVTDSSAVSRRAAPPQAAASWEVPRKTAKAVTADDRGPPPRLRHRPGRPGKAGMARLVLLLSSLLAPDMAHLPWLATCPTACRQHVHVLRAGGESRRRVEPPRNQRNTRARQAAVSRRLAGDDSHASRLPPRHHYDTRL